jgi:carboxyl-terminal processing protease
MLARNLIWTMVVSAVSLACYQKAQWNRHAASLSEAMTLIERNYLEPTSQRVLYENAMRGMVGSLDPHSGYISPKEYDEFRQVLDQQFGGIGVIVERDLETQRLTVIMPLPNSPAQKAGLQAGDAILAIDGIKIGETKLSEAVEQIHGPVGTSVLLEVLAPQAQNTREVRITRAEIPTDSVLGDARRSDGSWDFFLQEDSRILYLRVTSFGERTAEEMRAALNSVNAAGQRAAAVILDFRDNAGGLVPAAVSVCDMLLDHGVIVKTRGRGGVELRSYEAQPDLELPADIPVAVLINGSSASASEIVAACLQDHGRATVIGERSWGKGTVQTIIELDARSALRLTTATYWRPSDRNIHRAKDAPESADWGVRPDEGQMVAIPEADRIKIQRYRSYRDVYRAPSTSPSPATTAPSEPVSPQPRPGDAASASGNQSEAASDENSTEPATLEAAASGPPQPIDDPQFRRAIEVLQGKLSGPGGDSKDSN